MDSGLLLQYAIIAAVAGYSAWFVARRQFPAGVRRMRIALAMPLVRDGRPKWMRALGQRVAPAPLHRDETCGGCSGCG